MVYLCKKDFGKIFTLPSSLCSLLYVRVLHQALRKLKVLCIHCERTRRYKDHSRANKSLARSQTAVHRFSFCFSH
jgi:hypothetical protein